MFLQRCFYSAARGLHVFSLSPFLFFSTMPFSSGPAQTHPWHHRRHHGHPSGFRNPEDDTGGRTSPLKVARWLASYLLQRKANVPPPVRRVDPAALRDAPAPGRLRVTWIGHSTTLVQAPTATLLTDPIFSRRASPVPFAGPVRQPALPLRVEDLPPVDVVLLSHDHYDHLDRASALALHERFAPRFVVPLGVAAVLRRWGLDAAAELDWWQYVDLEADAGRLRIHCAPARHFSGRTLLGRDGTLWASYHLDFPDAPPLFYAGDSAYGAHFAEVERRLGAPEVALLPIGAYRPRLFMRPIHMDPPEALQAFDDLGARHLVPLHWGTFDLSEEPIHEPAQVLLQEAARRVPGPDRRVHVLDIGESLCLPPPPPEQAA